MFFSRVAPLNFCFYDYFLSIFKLCKESHSKPEDQGKRLPNLIPLGKLNNSKPKTSSGPSDVSKVTLRPSPPPLVPMPASAKAKLNDHHPKETQHFA